MGKLTFIAALIKAALRVPWVRLVRGPRRPSWSLRFEIYVDMLRHAFPRVWAHDYTVQRRVSASLSRPSLELRHVRVTTVGHGEWIEPHSLTTPGVYLYFHGGGFNGEYTQGHRNFVAEQALAIGCRAFAARYRLAPEHVFPAQLDDATAAFSWLREQTVEPIVIGGDSAGANLAIAVQLREKAAGSIALSPWLDLSADIQPGDDWIRASDWRTWASAYLDGADAMNPLVSPIYAELTGLPPVLLQVGTAEGLHAQTVRFAERARAAGVTVTLSEHADMVHDWQMFGLPESKRAVAEIAAFYRSLVKAR